MPLTPHKPHYTCVPGVLWLMSTDIIDFGNILPDIFFFDYRYIFYLKNERL